MALLQPILMYITVALAALYLIYRFLLPKSLLTSKKGRENACGQNDCGCH